MHLSKEQRAAVESRAKRIVVVATPGSGKTRTIVGRFLRLVKSGDVLASSIAVVTFTRYAARGMLERIGDAAGDAFIGTFHAWALRIILAWGHKTGLDSRWLTILSEQEADLEEREVLNDLGILSGRRWKVGTMGEWVEFKRRAAAGLVPDAAHEALYPKAWVALKSRLRAQNVMTYGTMIGEALQILSDEEAAQDLQRRTRHIMLDEAQDADGLQWRLVWAFEPETTFAVGDIDQAIYEWRGACPRMLLEFSEHSEQHALSTSYRFGFSVADAAGKLIRNNADRFAVVVSAFLEGKSTVQTIGPVWGLSVASMIAKSIAAGRKPGEIAVLSRTHGVLELLFDLLSQVGVDSAHVGSKLSIERTGEYRAILGYLRLSVNPRDKRAFMAVTTVEGFGTERILEIRERAVVDRLDFVEASDLELPRGFSGIKDRLSAAGQYEQFRPAHEAIRSKWFLEGQPHFAEFVRTLALESVQDTLPDEVETVTLCTIHAAKGLEWPEVYLVGMNAAIFPSKRSLREGRLEEERRLAYVGMTRAIERLVMVQLDDLREDDGPSRFVAEAGLRASVEAAVT